MPQGIKLTKARAQEILDAISARGSIRPAKEHWDVDDALLVAACFLFAARYTAPIANYPGERLHREHYEARVFQVEADLIAAVCHLSNLVGMVATGTFDDEYEGEVRAVVSTRSGEPKCVVVSGAKRKLEA